ncbi:hypothetical protein CSC94_10055 [Zhengella mangrovi]|uniref:DUF599 domain-containing protein n=1 Tax=Zhengella mangrovi TaxID=1982044 RepID=A0A2G1QPG6_9HYPH|nr:DUF599 family protein [Zhengella mangrovi]PHP67369.1 hypothetical protein CSC94_10055 [Zhengella mangrovi]
MSGLKDVIGSADLAALLGFVAAWLAFELAVDHTPLKHRSLSGLMARRRAAWMLVMAERDMRMVDTAVLSGLQQGAAYFGTVAMLAIGGCFAAMGATEQALRLFQDLPLVGGVSRTLFELKLVGLTLIYVYAFFKFGWSYRLFNYCSILVGSVPQPSDADAETRRRQAMQAGEMNILAGRHFTAGQRGLFMALAYLGWFAGPGALIGSTLFVIAVLVRRQFFSNARRAIAGDPD